MGECLLHLILLATFEVTVLGTDLPLLCQATGSEEWEVSLLNLCVSTTPSASIHLCPVACKHLCEEEPTAEHPSACCPIPSIWASLLAQPCCQTEQQGMNNKQLEEDLFRSGLLFCGALAFAHRAVDAGHCWQGRTLVLPGSCPGFGVGSFPCIIQHK